MAKETEIQIVIDKMVEFMLKIANDNSHGYSQAVRSLYNYENGTSYDCSSLVLTAIQYAFDYYGITPTPKVLGCTYTGNMLNLTQCGFEVVAHNPTEHSQAQKGDIELNTTYHVAMFGDRDNIIHARSSEGTEDTKDNSGNEIRVQPWYNYSRGWTHRLRFTGNGLNLANITTSTGGTYMFTVKTVKNGEVGNHVLLVQEILKARGFKGKDRKELTLDGECGVNCEYAIMQYQKAREKITPGICGGVDGVAGEKTLRDMIAL